MIQPKAAIRPDEVEEFDKSEQLINKSKHENPHILTSNDLSEDNELKTKSENREPDESIEMFCAELPRLIQNSRDDLKDYEDKLNDAQDTLDTLPGEIESEELAFRGELVEYATSLGKDALTMRWANIYFLMASAIQAGKGAHDLKVQYESINQIKNDLKKYETDKSWAERMIESEKAHLNRMLQTQKEKCNS